MPPHPTQPPTTNQRHTDQNTQKINNKTRLNMNIEHELINQFWSCFSKISQKRSQLIKVVQTRFAPNI